MSPVFSLLYLKKLYYFRGYFVFSVFNLYQYYQYFPEWHIRWDHPIVKKIVNILDYFLVMWWLTISSCQSFHIYIVLGFLITSSNRETFSRGTISLSNIGQFFFNINYSFIPGRYIVCTCKDPMWAIYLPEETCNELDNCTGIPKLDIILASPKFPVPLWKKIKLGTLHAYLAPVIQLILIPL